MNEEDEILWLQQLRNGEDEAFERLYKLYFGALSNFATKYVSDPIVAEDMVQDAFFKLFKLRPIFEHVTLLKSYLYVSIKNNCLSYLKHEKNAQRYYSSITAVEQETFFVNQIIEQELLLLLKDSFQILPSDTQKVFQLILSGFSNQEIAEQLQMSMDAVKAHKKRGRKLLRTRLGNIFAILLAISQFQ